MCTGRAGRDNFRRSKIWFERVDNNISAAFCTELPLCGGVETCARTMEELGIRLGNDEMAIPFIGQHYAYDYNDRGCYALNDGTSFYGSLSAMSDRLGAHNVSLNVSTSCSAQCVRSVQVSNGTHRSTY